MTAHRNLYDLYIADFTSPDPGDGEPIIYDKWGQQVPLVIGAGAETNTLAAPLSAGQRLTLFAREAGGGTRTITVASAINAAGGTTITLSSVDDRVTLESVEVDEDTYEWRVVVTEGAANQSAVSIPLTAFREVDASGDVGDGSANGGVLASNTTPILLGDAAECLAISWASSNSDALATSVSLPPDFDGTAAAYLDLTVTAGGATNAPSFTVETSWDGGAKVSDSAAGAAQTAQQTITATIAASDIPDSPKFVTIGLTPGAHTTDAWNLYAARLRYKRKALA